MRTSTEDAVGVMGLDAVTANAERLCWALRPLVRMVPAGDELCWVRFKVGVQEFTIGSEPMPEDEAAHFAGLFVFALAGAFRTLPDGVPASHGETVSQHTPMESSSDRLIGDGGGEAEFELANGEGMSVASASGPRAEAWREIQHYSAMYADEGPLTIYEVTRKAVTDADLPDSATWPDVRNRGLLQAAKQALSAIEDYSIEEAKAVLRPAIEREEAWRTAFAGVQPTGTGGIKGIAK